MKTQKSKSSLWELKRVERVNSIMQRLFKYFDRTAELCLNAGYPLRSVSFTISGDLAGDMDLIHAPFGYSEIKRRIKWSRRNLQFTTGSNIKPMEHNED